MDDYIYKKKIYKINRKDCIDNDKFFCEWVNRECLCEIKQKLS